MKKLTCAMLGGPESCNQELTGETFQEIGANSKAHAMEMFKGNDEAHKEAINKMMMATPEEQGVMMAEFEKRFNEAPSI